MIVAYLTSGYFKWAELFLKSLKLSNGTKYPVFLNTRDLSPGQLHTLRTIYPNLEIDNRQLNVKALSKKHNIPAATILASRKACEGDKATGNHRLWMNITADGDRIVSLRDVINSHPTPKAFLHLDIDLLFRGSLDEVFNLGAKNNVGLICRKGGPPSNRIPLNSIVLNAKNSLDSIVIISAVSIQNTPEGKRFMDKWVSYVNSSPMSKRNHCKWGQFAAWKTFCDLQKELSFFRFPVGCINDRFSPKAHAKMWYPKKKSKDDQYSQMMAEYRRLLKLGHGVG